MFEKINNLSYLIVNERRIPRVPTELFWADHLGGWKSRWGISRMKYMIEPGLYAVGDPKPESHVLVSVNYKLSFDHLRAQLSSRDFWIMVLDTKGINVWCAAGKGTFGTEEILKRIEAVKLEDIVSHRRLILPQLGAPSVAAHEVKRQSGFRVIYGPVRAEDLLDFIDAGMKATKQMRQVRFNFIDRIVLIPVELVFGAKYAVIIAACLFFLAGLNRTGYSGSIALTRGIPSVILLVTTYLTAVVFGPMLLPWLPGRAFALKGFWIGLILLTTSFCPFLFVRQNWAGIAAWWLIIPAITSFVVMNFTGASTYTSLSGVRREMRIAVPIQATAAVLGIGLWIAGLFL